MERVIKILIMFIGISSFAQAEVILRSARESQQVGDSQYPPSRFGEMPSNPLAEEQGRSPASAYTQMAAVKSSDTTTGKNSFSENVEVFEGQPGGQSLQVTSLVPSLKNGVQEVALIAGDLGYFPRTVFVTRDIPVRLYVTGASSSTLCIMIDSFNIRKQVRTNRIEEILFTPTLPGQYRYYCPVNGMEGTLVVRELKG